MKKIIYLLILVGLISCTDSNSSDSTVKTTDTKIEGKLANYMGGNVTLQLLKTQEIVMVDTLEVNENGEFTYFLETNSPSFYRLGLGNNNFFNFIISPKDQIKIEANANNLADKYSISGSEESNRLADFNVRLAKYYTKLDSVRQAMQQYQAQGDIAGYQQSAQAQYQISMQATQVIKTFIDEKPGSLASLAAVQNLNLDQDFEYFVKIEEGLRNIAQNSSYYQDLKQKVDANKKLAIGAEAPEIELQNPNGEMVKLSSLRGKVVLIDFWASWCKPCRIENPNVVRMYKKYNPKGFEIFGVSLDKSKQAWVDAIAQDQLTWLHVSDLQFWNSKGAKTYNVSSIPKTFLIDENGKIIGKDLRGEALENKLAEVFGKV